MSALSLQTFSDGSKARSNCIKIKSKDGAARALEVMTAAANRALLTISSASTSFTGGFQFGSATSTAGLMTLQLSTASNIFGTGTITAYSSLAEIQTTVNSVNIANNIVLNPTNTSPSSF